MVEIKNEDINGLKENNIFIDSLYNLEGKEINKIDKSEKVGEKNSNEITNELQKNSFLFNNDFMNNNFDKYTP